MYSGSIGVRGTHGEKSRFVTASHCIPKLTISGVVSDKEQKTISFCASKSDIHDSTGIAGFFAKVMKFFNRIARAIVDLFKTFGGKVAA